VLFSGADTRPRYVVVFRLLDCLRFAPNRHPDVTISVCERMGVPCHTRAGLERHTRTPRVRDLIA